MLEVEAITQLVAATAPGLINLITLAVQAAKTNDQATLDSLLAQATAAADLLKPAGAPAA